MTVDSSTTDMGLVPGIQEMVDEDCFRWEKRRDGFQWMKANPAAVWSGKPHRTLPSERRSRNSLQFHTARR